MALFMAYVIVIGALAALAGRLVEKCCEALRLPTRAVWVIVVVIAVVAPLFRLANDRIASVGESGSSAFAGATQLIPIPSRLASALHDAATFDKPVTDSLRPLDLPLAWLWFASSLFVALGLVRSAVVVRRSVRAAYPTAIDGVSVLLTTNTGPAIVGVWNYRIVLPLWVMSLSEENRRLIIAHERQHARAFDPLLIWVAAFVTALCPWNVGLWYTMRRLRTSIEIDCDGRVLDHTSDIRAYMTLLVDVVERVSSTPVFATALAESPSQLHRRILAMTQSPRRLHRLRAVSFIAGACAIMIAAVRVPQPASPLTELRERGTKHHDSEPSQPFHPRINLNGTSILDSAIAAARRLEPHAFDADATPGSTVIGLLYDQDGDVIHHASVSVPDTAEALRPLVPLLFPNAMGADDSPYQIMALIEGEAGSRNVKLVAMYLADPRG